jgi:excisionase family DNA binding protein
MSSTDTAGPDDLLTTVEVAALCRVNRVTVLRWMREKRLVGIEVGPRTFRFRRSDVEALLSPEPTEAAS